MKYLVTFVWALLISQVTFYLGSQLTQNAYNPVHGVILAVSATLLVAVIANVLPPVAKAEDESPVAKD